MRRLLSTVTWVAGLWGTLIAVTGGIVLRLGPIALRARAPERPFTVAGIALIAWALLYPKDLSDHGRRIGAIVHRRATTVAVFLSLVVAIHGLRFGSDIAGGADSYGYVSQAYAWADGTLPRPTPLRLDLRVANSDFLQTPLGYRPGPVDHTSVPTYAPGLPWLMEATLWIGHCGPYLVAPLAAAMFVWCTFLLGRQAGGGHRTVGGAARCRESDHSGECVVSDDRHPVGRGVDGRARGDRTR